MDMVSLVKHLHCGIETQIVFYPFQERCCWNCNKCGIQFEAVRMPDGKILIQPNLIIKLSPHYKNEIRLRVSQIELYNLGERRLQERLYQQGIKFDKDTVRYDNPKTNDIIFIQKIPSLDIDHTRYETYLQWFMDKFIIDKQVKDLRTQAVEDAIDTLNSFQPQRKDPPPSMLDLMKLYDTIYKKI